MTMSIEAYETTIRGQADPDGHAGVWDSGTNNWIPDLTSCTSSQPCPASTISAITGNLLRLFGAGPAGTTYPSISTWQTVYPHG